MTEYRLPLARRHSLLRTLAFFGLIKVVAQQADASVTGRFQGDDFLLTTRIPDLADWLVEEYRPAPVLSPWNGGSGFGAKDKAAKQTLDAIANSTNPRLQDFQLSLAGARQVVARSEEAGGWEKARLVRELRNECPDAYLPWLDCAVVILTDDKSGRSEKLVFPPLLGTGGNDGRLEFSVNFHQRLLEVLDASVKGRTASRDWASDLIGGTSSAKLVSGAVGQFDPGAAGTPNSSPFGAADSVVNPWGYVLMVEGLMLFAAAPARRLAAQTARTARAAMPFMTFPSAFGSATGAQGEEARGEVWVPVWKESLSFAGIRQIFLEGRAVWRGRIATSSSDMYLATASGGAVGGVSAFDRYVISRRNGLAFSASLADSVQTKHRKDLEVVARTEEWPDRVRALAGSSGAVRQAVRDFDSARVELAKAPRSTAVSLLRTYLRSVFALEQTVARSSALPDTVSARRVAGQDELLGLLSDPDWAHLVELAEFRIALGLASVVTPRTTAHSRGLTMRELLLPVADSKGRPSAAVGAPAIAGAGVRPLPELMADVLSWLSHQTALPVSGVSATGGGTFFGFRVSSAGVRVPSDDLHSWVSGHLDEAEIEEWFYALLAFDWRSTAGDALGEASSRVSWVDSTFALLAPFRDGFRPDDGADNIVRYGLTAELVQLIKSGHPDRARQLVQRRLSQRGFLPGPQPRIRPDRMYSARLAAALIPRVSGGTGYALSRASARYQELINENKQLPWVDKTDGSTWEVSHD